MQILFRMNCCTVSPCSRSSGLLLSQNWYMDECHAYGSTVITTIGTVEGTTLLRLGKVGGKPCFQNHLLYKPFENVYLSIICFIKFVQLLKGPTTITSSALNLSKIKMFFYYINTSNFSKCQSLGEALANL